MKKSELIETLLSTQAKESASAVCIDNIVGTLAWTGLSQDRQASMAALLDKLSHAARRRAERIRDCIQRIEGSSSDVF